MSIDWADVLKLVVPFVTAILMVWIKGWIEEYLMRTRKQHALSRLLDEEIRSSLPTVLAFKRVAETAVKGNLRLVDFEGSSFISKFASDLADLDPTNAYLYADLESGMEIVNKGIGRLSALTLSRVSATTPEVIRQFERSIVGQAKITATDTVSMHKAAIAVIGIIPEKHRYIKDMQAAKALEDSVKLAEAQLIDCPRLWHFETNRMIPPQLIRPMADCISLESGFAPAAHQKIAAPIGG